MNFLKNVLSAILLMSLAPYLRGFHPGIMILSLLFASASQIDLFTSDFI